METEMMHSEVKGTLSLLLLQKMNAYWRAANYLSVGQIYLPDFLTAIKNMEKVF